MIRAYSYIRFSHPTQMRGDSLRRQWEATQKFCKEKGFVLDEALSLRDLGVSGFREKNLRERGLAVFLDAVRSKRVPRGSWLIVENLDRLSRAQVRVGLQLWLELLDAGITIHTHTPERDYPPESANDVLAIMEVLFYYARANEESETKSYRIRNKWSERRKLATDDPTKKLTALAPAWVKLNDERCGWELDAERVSLIRRMADEYLSGRGCYGIAKRLTREGIPCFKLNWKRTKKRSLAWSHAYVHKILTHRALIGEYQPRHVVDGKRIPVGEPIPGYFPAILSEPDFYKIQELAKNRQGIKGREGKTVANLFTGLLKSAADGYPMRVLRLGYTRKTQCKRLVSAGAVDGEPGCVYQSIPYAWVEEIILSVLPHLKADHVQPPKPSDKGNETADLAGQLTVLRHKKETLKERIASEPDFEGLIDVLATVEQKMKMVSDALERAKAKSGNHEEVLGEAQSLIELLRTAKGEALVTHRLRLKAILRQIISEIRIQLRQTKADPDARLIIQFKDGSKRYVKFDRADFHPNFRVRPTHDLARHKDRPIDPPLFSDIETYWMVKMNKDNTTEVYMHRSSFRHDEVRAACASLGLPSPRQGEHKLFGSTVTGLAVRLPGSVVPFLP